MILVEGLYDIVQTIDANQVPTERQVEPFK